MHLPIAQQIPAAPLAPYLVKDINPGPGGIKPIDRSLLYFAEVNNTLFFNAYDPQHGSELWRSNGAAAGTVLVKDLYPGQTSSYPYELTNVNGTLFFRANDPEYGFVLWRSDGTEAGTTIVTTDVTPFELTNVNGTLYFVGNKGGDIELWRSDGTAQGTIQLTDIQAPTDRPIPSDLININGTLFFLVGRLGDRYTLWKSNGTPETTTQVSPVQFDGGTYGNYGPPGSLTNVNGTLFFRANDGTLGPELWRSDGTPAGTQLVKDLLPGVWGSEPMELTAVNNTLFFVARDGTSSSPGLWRSDGTAQGTIQIAGPTITPQMAFPGGLINVNGVLFFAGQQNGNNCELWKTTPSAAGIACIKDLRPGPERAFGHYAFDFAVMNGILYFNAYDPINGIALWRSDGAANGTVPISSPGQLSGPLNFTPVGKLLFFTAERQDVGLELWAVVTP